MLKRRFCQLAAAAVLAGVPVGAQGGVFQVGPDPAANKVAPVGTQKSSGWDYQFSWLGGFLGTPIAPHYFLSAKHLHPGPDGGEGSSFDYQGETYTATDVVADFGPDLRLYRVDKTFYSYAPLYDATPVLSGGDGPEFSAGTGKSAVMIGRGGPRGTEVRVGNMPAGA